MTPDQEIPNGKQKPLILFSSLDWGLGHTTRSIPLIKEFIDLECNVIVACNSVQKKILEPEIPGLQFVELTGYDVQYGDSRRATRFKMLLQLSKILTRIKKEKRWLRAFLNENKVKAIISDNRYGLHSSNYPCILITHQLHISTGYGRFADWFIRKFLYKYINEFSACWIPDARDAGKSLAGRLSHPTQLPTVPVRYLGTFSRLQKCKPEHTFTIDILIILSGPEPQRTILENIIINEIKHSKKRIALIKGLPGNSSAQQNTGSAIVFDHVPSAELNRLACQSALVICRSGYTTVMDMMKLQKRMIVIPTPGQPEQEYLANYLSKKQLAVSVAQNSFSLVKAEQIAAEFSFKPIDSDMKEYKTVIKDFVEVISSLSPSLTH